MASKKKYIVSIPKFQNAGKASNLPKPKSKNYDPLYTIKPQATESTAVRNLPKQDKKVIEKAIAKKQAERKVVAQKIQANPLLTQAQKNEILLDPRKLDENVNLAYEKGPDAVKQVEPQSTASRAWEYITNPLTASEYAISGGGAENMPRNINQMRMAGIDPGVVAGRNLVGNTLNYTTNLFDAGDKVVRNLGEGNYGTAAFEALRFLPGARLNTGLGRYLNKGYDKIATGNSRIPIAWKMEKPISNNLENQLRNLRGLTDDEARVVNRYLESPYNIKTSPEDSKILDKIIKENYVDLSEINQPITRINDYYVSQEGRSDIPTGYGESFSFPRGRSWSLGQGVTEGYDNAGKVRLVIPSKYSKELNQNFYAIDYTDPRLTQGIGRQGERELFGNVPEGFKVIGKSNEGGFENIFIRPKLSTSSADDVIRSGIGGMDMSRYEIKNPDYFTQLLDTYTSRQLPPSSKKFYKGLIESVKRQNGIVTERQYQELQRLKTGNFNYGKKAYEYGGLFNYQYGGGYLPSDVSVVYLPEGGRSYYDPMLDTIYLNPNALEDELNHEMAHAWQNRQDGFRSDPYSPKVLPSAVATDEQAASYYNRKGDDVDRYLNNLGTIVPEFGGHTWNEDVDMFIPEQVKYDKVVDPLMYNDAGTLEGEAEMWSQIYGRPPLGIKEYGGLFNYQSGGRKPIYITDPKEYKYRKAMYDDSLNLYKAYKMQDKLMGPGNSKIKDKYNKWTPAELKEGRRKKYVPFLKEYVAHDYQSEKEQFKDGYDAWTARPQDQKLIKYYKSLGFTDDNIMYHSSPDVVHPKIRAKGTYHDGFAGSPIYKKPIQPVEYRESVLPEPTISNSVEPIVEETIQTENLLPVQIPLRDEMVLPIGRTYRNVGKDGKDEGGQEYYGRFEKVVDPKSGKVRYVPKGGKAVEFKTIYNPTFEAGGKVIKDQEGQRKYPGKITEIQGNLMATDGYGNIPLYVIPDVGEPRVVMPNTGVHEFKGATKFVEYPIKNTKVPKKLSSKEFISIKSKVNKEIDQHINWLKDNDYPVEKVEIDNMKKSLWRKHMPANTKL